MRILILKIADFLFKINDFNLKERISNEKERIGNEKGISKEKGIKNNGEKPNIE